MHNEMWLNLCLHFYIISLSEEEKESTIPEKSMTKFRFGSGDVIESLKRIVIHADITGKRISIVTDVIDCDILLLLSKDAMKKAQATIDFTNDTVTIFGVTQKLFFTSSGHYCVPLGRHISLIIE